MGIRRHGVIWPEEFKYEAFIDLTVAKKWRLPEFADVKADPGDCMEAGLRALFPSLKFSSWTRDMVHDFAKEDLLAFIGCGGCGKSHAMAACGIAHWIVDPYDTAVVVGSATLKDLSTRAWSPTLSLFTELKAGDIPVPGKIVSNAYAILNEKDADHPESMAARASIQGRALDEGRIQGLHVPWVCIIVDELGLVKDVEALKTHIANIRIGTLGFKYVSAANPEPWESPNSGFYLPPRGVKVDENTGAWRSQQGYWVRHFDGLKSPVVLDHRLKREFHFLISQADVNATLAECNGDASHPRFWKMIRGFPKSAGTGDRTVLDPVVAAQCRCLEPLEQPVYGRRRRLGLVAGIDPAWSEGGDDAVYAGCEVLEQDGRVYLDFSTRVSKLPLSVDNPAPVTKQLRDGVVARLNADSGPGTKNLYVDSSGNQGLADDIDIYVGPGCGHINNSIRASEYPVRALDQRPAREHVYDRGTEAYIVLAEFCRAGQVRGLPQRAADAMTRRRFKTRPGSTDPVQPLRLEAKEEFIARFKGSPNEGDACALAALAAKERLGVLPFGGVPAPRADAMVPALAAAAATPAPGTPVPAPDYTADAADHDPGSGDSLY